MYTSLSYPALLFDWLITRTLTLINCDNIILEQSAESIIRVYVDLYARTLTLGGLQHARGLARVWSVVHARGWGEASRRPLLLMLHHLLVMHLRHLLLLLGQVCAKAVRQGPGSPTP